jgi:hypothetical protein
MMGTFTAVYNNHISLPQALREELDEGEPKYDITVQLNKQLMSDNVLEGRKATSSEKDLQSFATRFATLGKRAQDKKSALYTILLSLIQSTMDEVENDLTEANTKVDQTVLSERFPQVKQDFHNAKVFTIFRLGACLKQYLGKNLKSLLLDL